MRLYEVGYKLQKNEFLLKVKEDHKGNLVGFLTKLTKQNEIPKAFLEWENKYSFQNNPELPIQIHTEVLRKGWKLKNWRFGQSQNWAILIAPEGWTIEIYLTQFLEIVQTNTIIDGEIQGEFRWESHELINH